MNIKQLEYFVSVAETLSFTKASEKHFISQTAVTQQIKALEEQMQVILLNRTKRHVELTPAGKIFYNESKSIIKHITDSIIKTQQFANGVFGSLHIGIIIGYENTNLSTYLKRFSDDYPNVSLEIRRDGMTEVLNSIKQNSLDIGFVINPEHQPLKDFNYKTINKYSLVAVLPSTHLLAHNEHINLIDLKDENFIFVKENGDEYGQKSMIKNRYKKAGFIPNVTHRCNDINTIFLSIASNLGIAILPSFTVLNNNISDNISVVPLKDDINSIEVVAAWNKDSINPALKNFIELI